jgi:hypothetical protein
MGEALYLRGLGRCIGLLLVFGDCCALRTLSSCKAAQYAWQILLNSADCCRLHLCGIILQGRLWSRSWALMSCQQQTSCSCWETAAAPRA